MDFEKLKGAKVNVKTDNKGNKGNLISLSETSSLNLLIWV